MVSAVNRHQRTARAGRVPDHGDVDMFDYVKIEGFRSFRYVELELSPLSVFLNPPSKRFNDIFLSRTSRDRYHKIVDGGPLFTALQFEPVYRSCRYCRVFYDELKAVASR
jgi:hypothetical protein